MSNTPQEGLDVWRTRTIPNVIPAKALFGSRGLSHGLFAVKLQQPAMELVGGFD
jgi:hypothetical protein